MALSVHEELRKLDDLYRVKADLEQLPSYLKFHMQTCRHFRNLIEETVVSLAKSADRRLPGTPQDNMIENILDLRRRWLGSGPLEFQANSRCLSQLDGIVINELKRLKSSNNFTSNELLRFTNLRKAVASSSLYSTGLDELIEVILEKLVKQTVESNRAEEPLPPYTSSVV